MFYSYLLVYAYVFIYWANTNTLKWNTKVVLHAHEEGGLEINAEEYKHILMYHLKMTNVGLNM